MDFHPSALFTLTGFQIILPYMGWQRRVELRLTHSQCVTLPLGYCHDWWRRRESNPSRVPLPIVSESGLTPRYLTPPYLSFKPRVKICLYKFIEFIFKHCHCVLHIFIDSIKIIYILIGTII